MRKLAAIVTVVAAAAALISVAGAQPVVARQRLAIQSSTGHTAFTLIPLQRGKLSRDSGTALWGAPSQRFLTRSGQSVEINDVDVSLEGTRGTMVLRFRIEWVAAGHDYTIGSSRWTVVRGTGAYAGLTGGGLGASMWPPGGDVKWRAEGFLSSK